MRFALAGFSHETNTFATGLATYERFARSGILRGQEIVDRHGDAHSSLTGFVRAADHFGFEVVPLIFASTLPCGTITRDAFDRLVGELLELLEKQGPWDAVLLANHSAAVAEDFPDVDGEIAARVRALVGPNVPIGMALDLHGNISQRMIENTTACVFYRQNPHLDPTPRAFECAEIIYRTVRGEIKPVQALETPPLVVNIVKQFTGEEPMASLMRACDEVIASPGMLSASVVEGYPYADIADMGMSFLAIHDGDPAAARAAAQSLAGLAWEKRAELQGEVPSPAEAIAYAMRAAKGPVVLMDVGDNIGGGSPADSTILLAEARRQGARSFLQTLYDPESVAACIAAGVGNVVSVRAGGKTDDQHGEPVELTGRVRLIGDGKFEEPNPTHGGGRYFNGGITAVLETGDEYTIVLTSRRIGNTSIQQMYSLGIRPENKQIVVAKGVHSPRPAYGPIAAEVVLVNTPGVTTADLSRFNYQHRRRPLYPFEEDAEYPSLASPLP
ncbi:MAG TPA: M81 family metallopeptidase [Chloroflexota bacterium]|nr:M81 family metallopeptidase [Chloroflexota bacterium]